jgi:hypothetical protein
VLEEVARSVAQDIVLRPLFDRLRRHVGVHPQLPLEPFDGWHLQAERERSGVRAGREVVLHGPERPRLADACSGGDSADLPDTDAADCRVDRAEAEPDRRVAGFGFLALVRLEYFVVADDAAGAGARASGRTIGCVWHDFLRV